MPCTVRRARQLINAGRVSKREYRPFTIHLKDRCATDGRTARQPIEIRCDPGSRHSGIAVVAILDGEDRVLYQEEIQHRTDISQRLAERKGHRRAGKAPRAAARGKQPETAGEPTAATQKPAAAAAASERTLYIMNQTDTTGRRAAARLHPHVQAWIWKQGWTSGPATGACADGKRHAEHIETWLHPNNRTT